MFVAVVVIAAVACVAVGLLIILLAGRFGLSRIIITAVVVAAIAFMTYVLLGRV